MSSAAKPSPIPDRRVHAECATFEVVRYERAGKWYVESKGDGKREAVGVVEAAHRAVAAETLGGEVNLGLPGGSMFDRWIPVVQVKGGAARLSLRKQLEQELDEQFAFYEAMGGDRAAIG